MWYGWWCGSEEKEQWAVVIPHSPSEIFGLWAAEVCTWEHRMVLLSDMVLKW